MGAIGKIAGVVATIAAVIPGGQPIAAVAGLVSLGASTGAALTQRRPQHQRQGSALEWKIEPGGAIPYVIGRTAVGGTIAHRATYGTDLHYLTTFTILSLGPIAAVETQLLDRAPVARSGTDFVGYYNRWAWSDVQTGATPEGRALGHGVVRPPFGSIPAQPPKWSAQHRLSGYAAASLTLLFDTKARRYANGEPLPGWVLRGNLVWDPRLDSTYPGGSGPCRLADPSTWVYSETPALHGLRWRLGITQNGTRIMGVGAPLDLIDVARIVESANVQEANGWRVGGELNSGMDRWEALKLIEQAGGAEPVANAAMMSTLQKMPRVSLGDITDADIVGRASVPGSRPRRERINGFRARFRSEAHGWEMVPIDLVQIADYVAADGVARSGSADYALVQDKDQAASLAAYEIYDSRELGPIELQLKPRFIGYRIGDALTLKVAELGLVNQLAIVRGRRIDPRTGIVTLRLVTETTGKHAEALGRTGKAPPVPTLTYQPLTVPAPGAGDWTATGGQIVGETGGALPAIVITGAVTNSAADGVVFDFRAEGATAWTNPSIDAPDTVRRVVTDIAPDTVYEVGVRYKVAGVIGDRQVYGPVRTGGETVAGQPAGNLVNPNVITPKNIAQTLLPRVQAQDAVWQRLLTIAGAMPTPEGSKLALALEDAQAKRLALSRLLEPVFADPSTWSTIDYAALNAAFAAVDAALAALDAVIKVGAPEGTEIGGRPVSEVLGAIDHTSLYVENADVSIDAAVADGVVRAWEAQSVLRKYRAMGETTAALANGAYRLARDPSPLQAAYRAIVDLFEGNPDFGVRDTPVAAADWVRVRDRWTAERDTLQAALDNVAAGLGAVPASDFVGTGVTFTGGAATGAGTIRSRQAYASPQLSVRLKRGRVRAELVDAVSGDRYGLILQRDGGVDLVTVGAPLVPYDNAKRGTVNIRLNLFDDGRSVNLIRDVVESDAVNGNVGAGIPSGRSWAVEITMLDADSAIEALSLRATRPIDYSIVVNGPAADATAGGNLLGKPIDVAGVTQVDGAARFGVGASRQSLTPIEGRQIAGLLWLGIAVDRTVATGFEGQLTLHVEIYPSAASGEPETRHQVDLGGVPGARGTALDSVAVPTGGGRLFAYIAGDVTAGAVDVHGVRIEAAAGPVDVPIAPIEGDAASLWTDSHFQRQNAEGTAPADIAFLRPTSGGGWRLAALPGEAGFRHTDRRATTVLRGGQAVVAPERAYGLRADHAVLPLIATTGAETFSVYLPGALADAVDPTWTLDQFVRLHAVSTPPAPGKRYVVPARAAGLRGDFVGRSDAVSTIAREDYSFEVGKDGAGNLLGTIVRFRFTSRAVRAFSIEVGTLDQLHVYRNGPTSFADLDAAAAAALDRASERIEEHGDDIAEIASGGFPAGRNLLIGGEAGSLFAMLQLNSAQSLRPIVRKWQVWTDTASPPADNPYRIELGLVQLSPTRSQAGLMFPGDETESHAVHEAFQVEPGRQYAFVANLASKTVERSRNVRLRVHWSAAPTPPGFVHAGNAGGTATLYTAAELRFRETVNGAVQSTVHQIEGSLWTAPAGAQWAALEVAVGQSIPIEGAASPEGGTIGNGTLAILRAGAFALAAKEDIPLGAIQIAGNGESGNVLLPGGRIADAAALVTSEGVAAGFVGQKAIATSGRFADIVASPDRPENGADVTLNNLPYAFEAPALPVPAAVRGDITPILYGLPRYKGAWNVSTAAAWDVQGTAGLTATVDNVEGSPTRGLITIARMRATVAFLEVRSVHDDRLFIGIVRLFKDFANTVATATTTLTGRSDEWTIVAGGMGTPRSVQLTVYHAAESNAANTTRIAAKLQQTFNGSDWVDYADLGLLPGEVARYNAGGQAVLSTLTYDNVRLVTGDSNASVRRLLIRPQSSTTPLICVSGHAPAGQQI